MSHLRLRDTLAAGTAGLALAVGLAGPAAAQDHGGTLTVAVPETFSGFDPFEDIGRLDYNVAVNVFDTLTTYGPDYVPRPMLAESWEQTDETTWVFTLRQGVVFHDGTAFDAEAAKYSLDKLLASSFGDQFEAVETVEATGEHEITVTTARPMPTLLAQLTQPYAAMVSPTAYEADPEGFAQNPVGSGPFAFASWDQRSSLTLERNADYWRTDADGEAYPYLDAVEWEILPDAESAALALQAGEVDLLYKVPLPFVQALEAAPATEVYETPTLGWEFVMFRVDRPPFDNRHLRRAVQFAIDRQAIVETVAFGHAVPALGPIPPNSWAYDPAIETEGEIAATDQPNKVDAELEAAGMPDGFSFTLVHPTLEPFNALAQALQGQLAEHDITVELDGKEIGAALDDLFSSNFEALLIDWSGRIDEALTFPSFFTTDGFNTFGKYGNPAVDPLVAEAGEVSDIERRAELYQEAQDLIVADSPLAWITVPTELKAARAEVEGFTNYGDQRMRFFDTWIEE